MLHTILFIAASLLIGLFAALWTAVVFFGVLKMFDVGNEDAKIIGGLVGVAATIWLVIFVFGEHGYRGLFASSWQGVQEHFFVAAMWPIAVALYNRSVWSSRLGRRTLGLLKLTRKSRFCRKGVRSNNGIAIHRGDGWTRNFTISGITKRFTRSRGPRGF